MMMMMMIEKRHFDSEDKIMCLFLDFEESKKKARPSLLPFAVVFSPKSTFCVPSSAQSD